MQPNYPTTTPDSDDATASPGSDALTTVETVHGEDDDPEAHAGEVESDPYQEYDNGAGPLFGGGTSYVGGPA